MLIMMHVLHTLETEELLVEKLHNVEQMKFDISD